MKFRIKDKKKFERFIFITMMLIILLTYLFVSLTSSYIVEGKSVAYNSIVVKQGDTLWSIAEKIDSRRDIRDIIYDIQKLNKMNNSNLHPGEKIFIPAK